MAVSTSTTWIITDTHFGHDNIIKYCSRPENFAEIIDNFWIRNVGRNDLVIHLGDVAWPRWWRENKLKDLPGQKVLVRGNHDDKSIYWYMNKGFMLAVDSFSMKVSGMDILFTHEPVIFHTHDINIHGHLHNGASIKSACALLPISLENLGYRLIRLTELLPVCQKLVNEHKHVLYPEEL